MVENDQAARNNAGGTAVGDPLIGKILNGRFRVLEKLGAGGMGTVYKAIQAPLDRVVALKVLNQNYDSKRDPGFQRRFFLEASVTSKLKHPNTITVIDYGKTDDSIYYIAMEYVDGVTLAQVLTQEGSLSWNRVLHIGQQVARSLREAHKSGIIHRDLKPANVMVCNEETDHDLVKVLDFGLVKSFLPDSVATEGADITQAGVFLGSPQYMAPEQARNLADPRSDIYSLGVVLYQMLIGRPPFYAEQSIDVIVKHMKEPPQPFGAARPELDIPAEVEALVMKCLAKKPDDRYQSMDELLEAIRGAALGTGGSGAFSGSRTPPPLSQTTTSGAHRLPTSGPGKAPSGPKSQPGTSGPHNRPSQSGVRPHVSQSGVQRGAGSGAFRQPAASGAYRQPATSGSYREPADARPSQVLADMDITVDDTANTDAEIPVVRDSRGRGMKPLWLGVGAMSLLAIAGLGFLLLRPAPTPVVTQQPVVRQQPVVTPKPAPVVTPEPEEPELAALPETVKVRVDSEPSGAQVVMGTRNMGVTPLDFELPASAEGEARAELTVSLDGYVPQTVTAVGRGPEIALSAHLKKKPAVAPPPNVKPQKKPNGYKDDPY